MGWADLLIKLNVPYSSDEALVAAEEIMEFFSFHSKSASIQLARERGRFPAYEGSIYDKMPLSIIRKKEIPGIFFQDRPQVDWDKLVEDLISYGIRNATVTTVAPTGSLSVIAGVSNGIEPLFALSYIKLNLDKRSYIMNDLFVETIKQNGLYTKELEESVGENGFLENTYDIPERTRSVFLTAHEIPPEQHIKMQAVFQKYVDNSVSKTINLPSQVSKNEVAEIFEQAYKMNCKGETIYRDKSKRVQALSRGTDENFTEPRPVPEGKIDAKSYSVNTPSGRLSLFVREVEKKPFDVFLILGRAGSDITAFTEAIGRLISIALRCNIPMSLLADNLEGLGGRTTIWQGPSKILSVPDAIGKTLREEYLEKPIEKHHAEICPQCKNIGLEHSEGCMICTICGYEYC